jgi:hypothetical protein
VGRGLLARAFVSRQRHHRKKGVHQGKQASNRVVVWQESSTMATINASTKIKVPVKKAAPPTQKAVGGVTKAAGGAAAAAGNSKKGAAPPLRPNAMLKHPPTTPITHEQIQGFLAKAIGSTTTFTTGAPKTASTTRDRGCAAADLAMALKLHDENDSGAASSVNGDHFEPLLPLVRNELLRILESESGAADESLLDNLNRLQLDGTASAVTSASSIKKSASAVSLSSLVDESVFSGVSDTQKGKTMPPAAREGALLILRAVCEQNAASPHKVEPYLLPNFLAVALDETASSHSNVREAAADTVVALVQLANPWVFSTILEPMLLRAVASSTEWRVKAAALEAVAAVAPKCGAAVHLRIPSLIPALTSQVWDTKLQVSKAAKAALLAVCETNRNPDIRNTIPAVVNAICKPSENNKAVSELMGTTFVVPVTASTLAILCPILARALKEKLAIHKRAACLVISNMSKLVDSPQSVAPFGHLLVPELQKVAANVQFEEIRDVSLKALETLTKALGDQYRDEDDDAKAAALAAEEARVKAEQERIETERREAAAREEAHRIAEEAERKRFKEAMDAQRQLDEIARLEAEKEKADEKQRKEMEKLSTKSAGGQCQGCGLKKCKKTCMFYSS